MATSACVEFCCVAKRFDRPFLRLPAEAVPAPDASAGPRGAGDDERRSAADVDARDTDAAAAAVDATAGDAAKLAESTGLDGDAEDSDETEAEETATRVRLDEILRHIDQERLVSSSRDANAAETDETERDGAGNHATATPHEIVEMSTRRLVDSLDADAECLPVAFLEPLAHMSHRRERHCRVILQHACADAVIRGAAWFARRAAAEAPRIFASGDATEASRSDLRDVAFAGELAALLIHNLAIAASVKEPRDDDDTYLDEPAEKHPALAKDGKYDPMTSVVRHARWEVLVRDVFAMCEWLAKRERDKNPYRADQSGARETESAACPPVRAGAETTASSLEKQNENAHDEHAILCRGALGTYTGAFLALLEPDSARPRLLQMDGGAFVLRVFRCMGSILPARHGDAALDAVGVLHRVLWLRPDASARERLALMRALVAMETPLRSLDAGEIERVDRAEGAEAETTDPGTTDPAMGAPPRASEDASEDASSSAEPLARRGGGHAETQPESPPADEQCDPDDLWDWHPRDGYCANARPGEPFHPFRWHPESDRRALWRLCEAQAERVSVNGVLAGLRTHLPPPGSAGDGGGAAGGTVACTQAVHALRALFEDLGVLDAQAKHERALMRRAFETRTMWRQLRTAQMRELVEQLACVVETLGQGAPTSGGPNDDDAKKKKKKKTENPYEDRGVGSSSARISDDYSGAWRGFKTVVPKEGRCDGAVGASMAVFSAILNHPFQSKTLEEHPGFDGVWNAVTRALGSRCSCAFATFSTVCRLAGKGGYATKRLMSMPSAGCLSRALVSATRDAWPAVALNEMPRTTFLPRRDPRSGASDASKQDASPPEDAEDVSLKASRAKRKKKRRRREAWREKTAKDLARDAKAEARKAKRARRDAARANRKSESATAKTPAADADDADDFQSAKKTRASAERSTPGGDASSDSDTSDSSSSSDSDSEEDPLASSSNRLLLRATAAATLASFAHVQREWDELDRFPSTLSKYDQDATLDAIDVDDGAPDGLWRPRSGEEINKALNVAGIQTPPEACEALELWYAARGGDGAAAPSRGDLRAAREGLRVAFAASRARRTTADGPDSREENERETDPNGDTASAASLRFAREAQIETWWTMRWRNGLFRETRRRESADASPESEGGDSKRDARSDSSSRADASGNRTVASASEMRLTSWPEHAVRHPQLQKGPLPGGVDPEGVLGTAPLTEDILFFLSRPVVCETAPRDAVSRDALRDTGVAVEAIETLASDDKARFLLLPDAERVLERLAARVDETARLARRAAANGGFLPMDEMRDDDDDDETEKNASPANDDEKKTKKKKKKKKKKKTRVSFGDLCARNALIVHTLYSVTKESERENEGSAWPTLIACSDVLLGALHSILAQAREDREPAVAAGEGSQTECDAAATRETVIELCRNVIIVLAEMADPGNSRDTPELGAAWAEGVVTRKPWVLDELVRVMAAGGEDMKSARGGWVSENLASEDDSFGTPTRLSASADPSAKMAARFSFPRADGSDAAPGVASETAPEPEPENEDAFSSASGGQRVLRGIRNPANPAEVVLGSGQRVTVFENPANPAEHVTTFSDVDAQDFQRKNPTWEIWATTNVIHTGLPPDADPARSYLGGAARDCAHIAAAAVFGVLSWDASLKAFLEREAARDSGLPSAGALISRTLALLSDAWKPTTRADAFDDAGATDASIRDPEASEHPHFLEHSGQQSLQALSLRGIESAGLLARLAGDDAGRRALVAHAPGIVGYLAPCLDSRLGQTAAFAARALSGLARGEAGDKQMEKNSSSSRVTPTVLEKYPYPETLVARLAEMLSDQTPQGERELPGAVARRDPGLDAHVLSEAVVAVAALARDKPWRWRLVDVRSTSRSGPPRACGTSEAATRLVANLARLLGDATRPEIAFNALYCVNCLMGEPPQSWGRGRDASREEDHAARRAFIAAASRAQGVPIETRLAEILHPEFTAAAAAAATREEEEEEAPPPDCRLNATLVIANVAGDAEGRRRLLEVAGDRLVAGLAAAIVGPDPERAMLAAYSLGELARPLPGCELALGGAARAELAARGVEDRHVFPDSGGGDTKKRGLDASFVKALPFLEARGAASPAPFGGTETLETLETLETHPLVAARRARAEAVAASARGAAAAARAVLADGEAHLRDWIARGDETRLENPNADSSHATYSYERDHRAQEPLRALPLGVKRKWLLEMLRWELGPVSAGVPLPGVAGVALDVDRAEILRDLCRHCEVPRANSGERERGFGVFGVPGSASAESTESQESQESQDTDASGDEQTTEAPASPAPVPKKKRAARGAFLSPPRGGVSVRFVDERGEGAAVRREWFGLVAERSADFTHGLFVSHDGGRSLHPHACSGAINPKTHLKYFAALGRVAAVALYHGETLPLRLTDTFLDRAVLGARASLEDLKSVDPTLYANKVRYLMDLRGSAETTAAAEDASPTRETGNRETAPHHDAFLDATVRALDLEWSDAADPTGVFFPGETRAFTLLPTSLTDKTSQTVTAETLATYLRAFVAHRTYGSVSTQTAAFAAGFGAVVPPPLRARMRSVLRGAELSSLVAGEPGAVDAADWRRNTGYADAPLAVSFSTRCFWHALERVLTDAERVDVLRFATGLSAAPAGGFANLVGYAGDAAPFTVAELASDARDAPRALPMAHACFNTIRLPRLAERAFGGSVEAGGEEMARRLRVATALGARGFDNF